MKKKIIPLYFILSTYFVFSQHCEETGTVILNGEIYDYQLEDCTANVTISTSGENTILHGITFIDAIESINIKPTGNNKITIKPDDSLDFIDLLTTNVYESLEEFLSGKSRTNIGNSDESPKNPDGGGGTAKIEGFRVYPTPADNILNISTDETVLYYKIIDANSNTLKQGSLPTNNQLDVDSLTAGVHYLLMKTNTEVVVIRFYKN